MALKDTYLAGILATVPEAERGKAEAALTALEEGNLRQADYSRQSAEAQAAKKQFDDLHAKNVEWFQTRQRDLAELDDLRAQVATGITTPDPTKPIVVTPPLDVITKKELADTLATLERGAVGVIAESNLLGLQHYKEFGEVLNVLDLLADPRVQQIGLKAVYLDKFKDQIKAKTDAAQASRDEALRKEGEDRARIAMAASRHPYPVVGNEPSALDAIEDARAGKTITAKSVDDMSAEFARLSAARVGVGA